MQQKQREFNDSTKQKQGKTMRKLAKFEKVTYTLYADFGDKQTYEDIVLPKRATAKSAGYDFFAPTDIDIMPQQTVTVATGIRVLMPDDWCLLVYPRSGLGFKYKLRLNNTVGIIDADYCDTANEGHIFIRMTNESDKPLHISKGNAFAQGIFTKYLLTEDDQTTELRQGGLGSTDKSNTITRRTT